WRNANATVVVDKYAVTRINQHAITQSRYVDGAMLTRIGIMVVACRNTFDEHRKLHGSRRRSVPRRAVDNAACHSLELHAQRRCVAEACKLGHPPGGDDQHVACSSEIDRHSPHL